MFRCDPSSPGEVQSNWRLLSTMLLWRSDTAGGGVVSLFVAAWSTLERLDTLPQLSVAFMAK